LLFAHPTVLSAARVNLVQKWKPVLLNPKARKQAIIATMA
jgi:hypothetical protein